MENGKAGCHSSTITRMTIGNYGERGRTRTCDPCLKRVGNPITNNNLHVQLTPCTTQQNQADTNKTFVWVPGGCPEPSLSNNGASGYWIVCNARNHFVEASSIQPFQGWPRNYTYSGCGILVAVFAIS
jgi:hypothetical protein